MVDFVVFSNILLTKKLRPTNQRLVQSCSASKKRPEFELSFFDFSAPSYTIFPNPNLTLLGPSHLSEVLKNFYFSQASEGVLMRVSRCFSVY